MHFSRDQRIRSRSEFDKVRHHGKRVPGRFFHLQVMPAEEEVPSSRLGLVVSRRVGPAVVRNRVKRRFREIFRELLPAFSESCDVVVIARHDVERLAFADVRANFIKGLSPWLNESLLKNG